MSGPDANLSHRTHHPSCLRARRERWMSPDHRVGVSQLCPRECAQLMSAGATRWRRRLTEFHGVTRSGQEC
jgi:hypothetical protein